MKCKKGKILTLSTMIALSTYVIFAIFPGQQKVIAWSLATGIGISDMQTRIDYLEEKAINKEAFNKNDKKFLKDLFSTMATGAKCSLILSESGKLTSHYLEQTGKKYQLPVHLFNNNNRVKKKMIDLKNQLLSDIENNSIKNIYESKRFYMPDKSVPDSIYALYYGKLFLIPKINSDGIISLSWRAEVPWYWPKYDFLKKKYDDFKAHRFSIPNIKSIIFNKDYALKVDDGLGEYLVTLKIAKPFLTYAEWNEDLNI